MVGSVGSGGSGGRVGRVLQQKSPTTNKYTNKSSTQQIESEIESKMETWRQRWQIWERTCQSLGFNGRFERDLAIFLFLFIFVAQIHPPQLQEAFSCSEKCLGSLNPSWTLLRRDKTQSQEVKKSTPTPRRERPKEWGWDCEATVWLDRGAWRCGGAGLRVREGNRERERERDFVWVSEFLR